ncbi:transmembrane protein, putative [Medicago truncatula]|uniref:Transmembrane protein, putative n=1 Tax=Medicago truncatula TaxID=3880 RepID=A0A072TKU2_MEDTR|nr:transmembrane protein, putative [Medicago truncatula]
MSYDRSQTHVGCKLYIVFLFICLSVLLISASEAKEKNCRVKHHTNVEHTNGCDKSNCNEVCINKDHATYGYCVPSIPYFSFCFCYFC